MTSTAPNAIRGVVIPIVLVVAAGLFATAVASAPPAQARDRVGKIVKREGTPVTVGPGEIGTAYAKCRPGETLIGGGAASDGAGVPGPALLASAPVPGSQRLWMARVTNVNQGGDTPRDVLAFAYCAKPAARDRIGVIVKRSGRKKEIDSAKGYGSATARCRRGERLVGGGGGGIGPAQLQVSAPHGSKPRKWFVRAYTIASVPSSVKAFAYCARPARRDTIGRIVRRKSPTVDVAYPWSVSISARCRRTERLVGGGAIGGVNAGGGVFLQFSGPQPKHPRRWQVRGVNQHFHPETKTLRAFAFCARKG